MHIVGKRCMLLSGSLFVISIGHNEAVTELDRTSNSLNFKRTESISTELVEYRF